MGVHLELLMLDLSQQVILHVATSPLHKCWLSVVILLSWQMHPLKCIAIIKPT